MSGELARVLERARQNRAALTPATQPATPNRLESGGGSGGTFVAGSRAFDTVTGEHVEVLGGTTENVIIPATQRAER